MKVLKGKDSNKLTWKQKKKALRPIHLVKIKRCVKVKGRMCVNGAPYRNYVAREEAKSPTVSMETLFATMLIDGHENRRMYNFDVPGAYLHVDILENKFVLLLIEGCFVDVMTEECP